MSYPSASDQEEGQQPTREAGLYKGKKAIALPKVNLQLVHRSTLTQTSQMSLQLSTTYQIMSPVLLPVLSRLLFLPRIKRSTNTNESIQTYQTTTRKPSRNGWSSTRSRSYYTTSDCPTYEITEFEVKLVGRAGQPVGLHGRWTYQLLWHGPHQHEPCQENVYRSGMLSLTLYLMAFLAGIIENVTATSSPTSTSWWTAVAGHSLRGIS